MVPAHGAAAHVRVLASHLRGATDPPLWVLPSPCACDAVQDREELTARCAAAVGDCVVVTHGSDTLLESAGFVLARWRQARATATSGAGASDATGAGGAGGGMVAGLAGKTVVFTAALRPERFVGSDAAFNVGGAVVASTLLPPGVYVSMQGRVFAADACARDAAGTLVASTPTAPS